MAPGERLEQEDLRGQTAHLVKLDHKDHLEMLVILDIWVHQGKGDPRALQASQAKMENQAKQETLGKLDSPDHQGLEDFLGHLGLQA